MRDFFTGLAARSFGAETGVRPRLASIFEPARNQAAVSAGFSAPDREREKEGVAAPDELRRRKISLRPIAESLARTEIPGLSREPQRHNSPGSIEEHSRDIRVELVSSKTAPSRQDSPHEVLRSASASNLFPRDIGASATMRAEASSETRTFIPPSSRAQSVEIEADQQRPVDADRASRDGNNKLASVSAQDGRHENQPPSTLSSRAIADLAARMREAASAMNTAAPARQNHRDSDRETSGSAEPIVHVTIGRVEVRATAEAPREKRPRKASPVMGVEEYLQRTAQRGGR
ncbi:MAG TPA: hypothetical protein VFB43_01095 [Terracidiphilus sp.]|nr:hypothetical protein [Terracidiphilus sp.]